MADTQQVPEPVVFEVGVSRKKPENIRNRKNPCPFCNVAGLTDIFRREGDRIWLMNKFRTLERTVQTVLIESAEHEGDISTYGRDENRGVFRFAMECFYAMRADARFKSVVMFKNYGPLSGGSLLHPHLQIVGFEQADAYAHIAPAHFAGIPVYGNDDVAVTLSDHPLMGFVEINIGIDAAGLTDAAKLCGAADLGEAAGLGGVAGRDEAAGLRGVAGRAAGAPAASSLHQEAAPAGKNGACAGAVGAVAVGKAPVAAPVALGAGEQRDGKASPVGLEPGHAGESSAQDMAEGAACSPTDRAAGVRTWDVARGKAVALHAEQDPALFMPWAPAGACAPLAGAAARRVDVLADAAHVACRYLLTEHHGGRCTSYNLFFYPVGEKLWLKVMPRWVTSPYNIGYGITQVNYGPYMDDVRATLARELVAYLG